MEDILCPTCSHKLEKLTHIIEKATDNKVATIYTCAGCGKQWLYDRLCGLWAESLFL